MATYSFLLCHIWKKEGKLFCYLIDKVAYGN